MSLPPICGKKPVATICRPNTFRVINEVAEQHFSSLLSAAAAAAADSSVADSASRPGVTAVNVLGQSTSATRDDNGRGVGNAHRRHYTQYLTSDVKMMLAPICSVRGADDGPWWEHKSSLLPTHRPPTQYTLCSTVRADFTPQPSTEPRNTRHSANPNKTPAFGGAPVNLLPERDGSKRFWKETRSFEHDFDSRLDPSHRPRGKRRGNFVWKPMSRDAANSLLARYSYNGDKDGESCQGLCHPPEPCQDWRPAQLRDKYQAMDDALAAAVQPCRA